MKKRILMVLLSGMLLSSCQFKKDVTDMTFPGESAVGTEGAEESTGEESTEEEIITVNLYHVEFTQEQYEEYNLGEALSQLLWGMTEEESLIYQELPQNYPRWRYTKTWCYEVNENSPYTFFFCTHEYKKARAYEGRYSQMVSAWEFHNKLPESEIDACTREEAIAFCQPYATALGLGGDDVTIETYGITLSILQRDGSGAPYESYEYYLPSEIRAKRNAGLEEEAKAMEASNMNAYIDPKKSPWEKKHEAVLVVYRIHVDGIEINDDIQMATMIYVPYYNEIVTANGYLPFGIREVIGTETLITKKEALSEVRLQTGGINEVTDIILTYIYLDDDEWDRAWKGTLHPAWRVDYIKGGQKKSMWVDAVDGFVRNVSGVD